MGGFREAEGGDLTVRVVGRRSVDVAIGGLAGVGGGLLGVGGGFLMVPLQVIWTRMAQRRASGTSLAAILPMAVVGACVYYLGARAPQVQLVIAFVVMVGSAGGALVGARLSPRVPERTLKMIVSVLLAIAGLIEIRDAFLGGLASPDSGNLSFATYALIALSGALIGALSGLTGVGGGVLLVPTLVVGFGVAQRVAQGTSLLAILPTAAIGAIVHQRQGDLDTGAAARMSLGGVPGVLAGSALALWLQQSVLAGLFGSLLLILAVGTWPRGRKNAVPA